MSVLKLLRAVLYARVSTKDKGQEVENQLVQLREFAARCGWTLVHEYIDHESGKTSDREQFEQLFLHASQRKFDVVIFWALDRFTREGVLPTLQHLQRLTSHGVGYRSFTEQYIDSCGIFKDAVIAIIATIAKQERVRFSERVNSALERRKEALKEQGYFISKKTGKRCTALGRPPAEVDIATIVAMRENGSTWDEVAGAVRVSRATAIRAFLSVSKTLTNQVQ